MIDTMILFVVLIRVTWVLWLNSGYLSCYLSRYFRNFCYVHASFNKFGAYFYVHLNYSILF